MSYELQQVLGYLASSHYIARLHSAKHCATASKDFIAANGALFLEMESTKVCLSLSHCNMHICAHRVWFALALSLQYDCSHSC